MKLIPFAPAAVVVALVFALSPHPSQAAAKNNKENKAPARAASNASLPAPELKTPATTIPDQPLPQSTFVVPKKKEDGLRNPFFPNSTQPYGEEANPSKPTGPKPPPAAELVLKGISGTEDRPLAIINTTTFTVGEENDVITKAGRMKIRCLEINMTNGTVAVQLGGERRELRLPAMK